MIPMTSRAYQGLRELATADPDAYWAAAAARIRWSRRPEKVMTGTVLDFAWFRTDGPTPASTASTCTPRAPLATWSS